LSASDCPAFGRNPESGKLRTRLRGIGGREADAAKWRKPAEDRARLHGPAQNTADLLVAKMVPGTRMRIKLGLPQRKFFGKANKECGEIPAAKVVVVTQRKAVDKPGFSRFFRPADPYLNGECSDDDGYYIGRNFWCLCSSILLVIATPLAAAETKLFDSVQVTPAGEYTFGIEGPAADLDGNLFVVNFGKPGTIAGCLRVALPRSHSRHSLREASATPSASNRNGTMFIADYKKHNIFAIRRAQPSRWSGFTPTR